MLPVSIYKNSDVDFLVNICVGNNNAIIDRKRTLVEQRLVPFEQNNVVYIPLELACKAIGGAIEYDKKEGICTLRYDGTTIKLNDNRKKCSVNGKKVYLGTDFIIEPIGEDQ